LIRDKGNKNLLSNQDPYLQEYVPIVIVLKDRNSNALYPVIIGTKKFQASDRAIALILLIAQLFDLIPISDSTNFEKLKHLITSGVVIDLIGALQTGQLDEELIQQLKEKYGIDKDYIPDSNILNELGSKLKQLFKLKKYSDSEIIGALKQFELAFSESIYISLGNIMSAQDLTNNDEQTVKQIIESTIDIFEEDFRLINEILLEKLLFPAIIENEDILIRTIFKIQELVQSKKLQRDFNIRRNLELILENINLLFEIQKYLAQMLSRFETQITITKYISRNTARKILTAQSISNTIAQILAKNIFDVLISLNKNSDIPIVNMLTHIQSLFRNNKNYIQAIIQTTITGSKEQLINLIVPNLNRTIADIYSIVVNSSDGRQLLSSLINSGYIPRINNQKILDLLASYFDNKVKYSLTILQRIIDNSIVANTNYGIQVVTNVLLQTSDCLNIFRNVYGPIYKNTALEKLYKDNRYTELICSLFEAIENFYTDRVLKLLSSSRIDSIINELFTTANDLANVLSDTIIKQFKQQIYNMLYHYMLSNTQNVDVYSLKNQLETTINLVIVNIRDIIQQTLSAMVTKLLIMPIYTLYLLVFELLLFSLQNHIHATVLTSIVFLNTREWRTITDVIKSFGQRNKNSLINLKVLFEKYGINYALIVHEFSVKWMYGILSILEFDRLYDENAEDEEHKLPAPGEWAKLTEENIKYIVKYIGKIMKVPIITYNDENQRVVYFLPLMKNAIKTNLQSVKKFIGVEEE
jgi:hypothetical protein